jgi:TRAP-type transport system small permease protein
VISFGPHEGPVSLMRRLTAAARILRNASMIALAVMMLVTVVDVTLRNTINQLVPGGVELVQLALVVLVFLALPETVLRGEHITIDAIDHAVSPRVLRRLRLTAAVLTLFLLVALTWRTLLPALDTIAFGDTTSDLGIGFIWYWLPIVVGVAAAALAQAVLVARAFAAPRGERDG